MENSADEDAALFRLVEDDVLSFLNPSKAGMHQIATPADGRIGCNSSEASGQFAEIKLRLFLAPDVDRVIGDIGKIEFGE
jgi:hypothetical protein